MFNIISHKNIFSPLILITLITFSHTSFAIYPRDYIPAPAGTTALITYYNHADSTGRYSNGNKLAIDMTASTRVALIRPVHFFDWADTRMAINAIIPVGSASLKGNDVTGGSQTSSGMGDPIINFAVFLVNDPQNKIWFGISESLRLPAGDYDNTRSINLGANRVTGKTEFSLSKGIGTFILDITGSFTIHGANSNFSAGNLKMEQDILWAAETHLSHNLSKGSYLALGMLWKNGGETKRNGVVQNDEKRKTSLQVTYSNTLAPKNYLAVLYKQDLDVLNGFKFSQVSLRYSYIF